MVTSLLGVSCSLLLIATVGGQIFTIQADFKRNRKNHPVWDLSKASNGKAVILAPEKTLSLNFCLRQQSNVTVNGFRFSNGNLSETVIVQIDRLMIGKFQTPATAGSQWNNFLVTSAFPRNLTLKIGWHKIAVKFNGTADGIAVDKIDLQVYDSLLTSDIFSCRLTCVPDHNFSIRPNKLFTQASFMVQESYKTICAEVDNVNIPIFNPRVKVYEITAAHPQYRTFSNRREANNTGCPHLSPIYWSFNNLDLANTTRESVKTDKAIMHIYAGQDFPRSKLSLTLVMEFKLEGRSKGMIDSLMGTILKIKFKHLSTDVSISMRYTAGLYSTSSLDVKMITSNKPDTEWNMKDFTWTENEYNLIFLYIDSNTSQPLQLDYLYLERRPMVADKYFQAYKNDDLIVELVFSNFWWLAPDSMTVHLSNGQSYSNVSYFRIYKPIPWNSGYAQVFVMYMDGNARLLPVPPEGRDWIPFGSSVIIGQTDPTDIRPYTSITDATIDLDNLVMDLKYKDRGFCKLTLVTTLTETRVIVSNIHFGRNPILYPFTTFRSMYVSESNTDVDHVSTNGIYSKHIMEDFGAVMGRSFVFYRNCMSRHLNLSPDIYIDIRRTNNNVTLVPLTKLKFFQQLLDRIKSNRIRLWTPRLNN